MADRITYPIMDHRGSVVAIVDQDGTVLARREYNAFGELLSESGDWSQERFAYQSNWIQLKESDARLYITPGGRMYEAETGRFIQREPTKGIAGDYCYVSDNPVTLMDPDGRAEASVNTGVHNLDQDVKEFLAYLQSELRKMITEAVVGTGQVEYYVFIEAADFCEKHPRVVPAVNLIIDAARPLLARAVNTDPKTLGWIDLVMMWLLELGKEEEIHFDAASATTQDLKQQVGVNEAREIARKWRPECPQPEPHRWHFGTDALLHANLCTMVLGSYYTYVTVTVSADGKRSAQFKVKNTSQWESATRLRRPTEPGGENQGAIPSRKRGGQGIHLGGNLEEEWCWEEDLSPQSAP